MLAMGVGKKEEEISGQTHIAAGGTQKGSGMQGKVKMFRLFVVAVAVITIADSIVPCFVLPLRPIISYPVMIFGAWVLLPLVIFTSIMFRRWNGVVLNIAAMVIFAVVHVCSTLPFHYGSAPFKGTLLLVVWESPLHPTTYVSLYGKLPLSTRIHSDETGISPEDIYSQHLQLPDGVASVGDGVAFDARAGETYGVLHNWAFPLLN